jgi:hypothetical protein
MMMKNKKSLRDTFTIKVTITQAKNMEVNIMKDMRQVALLELAVGSITRSSLTIIPKINTTKAISTISNHKLIINLGARIIIKGIIHRLRAAVNNKTKVKEIIKTHRFQIKLDIFQIHGKN